MPSLIFFVLPFIFRILFSTFIIVYYKYLKGLASLPILLPLVGGHRFTPLREALHSVALGRQPFQVFMAKCKLAVRQGKTMREEKSVYKKR
jgi:hypothetical protein